jgi:hypothetical protein
MTKATLDCTCTETCALAGWTQACQVGDLLAQQELVLAGGGCHGVVGGAVDADAHVPPLDVRDGLQLRLCLGILGLRMDPRTSDAGVAAPPKIKNSA